MAHKLKVQAAAAFAPKLTVWRPKSARHNGRYILMGEIDDPQDYAPRVLLVNRDFPWISTTAFRADEIEEVR